MAEEDGTYDVAEDFDNLDVHDDDDDDDEGAPAPIMPAELNAFQPLFNLAAACGWLDSIKAPSEAWSGAVCVFRAMSARADGPSDFQTQNGDYTHTLNILHKWMKDNTALDNANGLDSCLLLDAFPDNVDKHFDTKHGKVKWCQEAVQGSQVWLECLLKCAETAATARVVRVFVFSQQSTGAVLHALGLVKEGEASMILSSRVGTNGWALSLDDRPLTTTTRTPENASIRYCFVRHPGVTGTADKGNLNDDYFPGVFDQPDDVAPVLARIRHERAQRRGRGRPPGRGRGQAAAA